MDRIKIEEFARYIELAKNEYPDATILSIGTGSFDDIWYYSLFLEVDGKEVRYEIPCYEA